MARATRLRPHALRFTAPETRDTYIYPARHEASDSHSSSLPPTGLRVRLKANADHGSPWYVSGMSDPRFDDDVLHELDRFTGSDLQVVDTSGLVNGP